MYGWRAVNSKGSEGSLNMSTSNDDLDNARDTGSYGFNLDDELKTCRYSSFKFFTEDLHRLLKMIRMEHCSELSHSLSRAFLYGVVPPSEFESWTDITLCHSFCIHKNTSS